MRTEYHVTGSERKRLVRIIAGSTGETARYLGMPSAAYEIGPFTVTKDGALEYDDGTDSATVRKLYEDIAAAGFVREEQEAAGFGLSVIFPADTLSEDALHNLEAILAAKGSLIRKALGADDLRIDRNEQMVSFPWFNDRMLTTEETRTYTHFISALCEMARNRKRINAKERETGSEKYAFRCFLLSLGFIGPEFKTERKILLKRLSGSSAFRNGGAEHDVSGQGDC